MARVLERAYAYYNRRYFRGKLPPVHVRWTKKLGPDFPPGPAYGWFFPDEGVILISSILKKHWAFWHMTLLHEMCHVALQEHPEEQRSYRSDRHSRPWHREMRRLAAAGAFDRLW